MKLIYIKILLGIIIFATSCNPKQPNENIFDPEALKSVFLESEKFNNPKIINPLFLFSMDSFLIVTEDRRISPDQPLVHLFLKESLTYFSSKGSIGFGPYELPSADVFNRGHSEGTFLLYSGMDKKFVAYDIYDSSRLGISEFKMPESETPLGLLYFLPDSTFIGMSTYDENKYLEVNFQGNKVNGYGKWEEIEGKKDLSFFHHFILNNGWFRVDDDFSLFVNASIFRDRLEIFDLKTRKIKTIDGPSAELPDFEFYEPNMPLNIPISNPFRYRDVFISKNRIYALYGGLNEAHYKKTSELAKKIFVFTRNGEPVLKFDLDRSISSIVVDERLNKIYGVTTDEDPGIAVFNIPANLF